MGALVKTDPIWRASTTSLEITQSPQTRRADHELGAGKAPVLGSANLGEGEAGESDRPSHDVGVGRDGVGAAMRCRLAPPRSPPPLVLLRPSRLRRDQVLQPPRTPPRTPRSRAPSCSSRRHAGAWRSGHGECAVWQPPFSSICDAPTPPVGSGRGASRAVPAWWWHHDSSVFTRSAGTSPLGGCPWCARAESRLTAAPRRGGALDNTTQHGSCVAEVYQISRAFQHKHYKHHGCDIQYKQGGTRSLLCPESALHAYL